MTESRHPAPLQLNSEGVLICPACGFHCTHHELVEVYSRDEDRPTQLVAIETTGQVTMCSASEANSDKNPSRRRHGLRIYFWCEGCPTHFQLEISQHKGETCLEMCIEGAGGSAGISRVKPKGVG